MKKFSNIYVLVQLVLSAFVFCVVVFDVEIMSLGFLPLILADLFSVVLFPVLFGLKKPFNYGNEIVREIIETQGSNTFLGEELQQLIDDKKIRPRYLGIVAVFNSLGLAFFHFNLLYYWVIKHKGISFYSFFLIQFSVSILLFAGVFFNYKKWTGLRKEMTAKLLIMPLMIALVIAILGWPINSCRLMVKTNPEAEVDTTTSMPNL